jgi:hypothetical protein
MGQRPRFDSWQCNGFFLFITLKPALGPTNSPIVLVSNAPFAEIRRPQRFYDHHTPLSGGEHVILYAFMIRYSQLRSRKFVFVTGMR